MKAGDEVVCVDAEGTSGLVKGKHYVLTGVYDGCCQKHVTVGIPISPSTEFLMQDGTVIAISLGFNVVSCSDCGSQFMNQTGERMWKMKRFAPLEEIPESHVEAIEELLEEVMVEVF